MYALFLFQASESLANQMEAENEVSEENEVKDESLETSTSPVPKIGKESMDSENCSTDTSLPNLNETSNSDDTVIDSDKSLNESGTSESSAKDDNQDISSVVESEVVELKLKETVPEPSDDKKEDSPQDGETNENSDDTKSKDASAQNSDESKLSHSSEEKVDSKPDCPDQTRELPEQPSSHCTTEVKNDSLNSVENTGSANEMVFSENNSNNLVNLEEKQCSIESTEDVSDADLKADKVDNEVSENVPSSDCNGTLESPPPSFSDNSNCSSDVKLLVSSMCDHVDQSKETSDSVCLSPKPPTPENSDKAPETETSEEKDFLIHTDSKINEMVTSEDNFDSCLSSNHYNDCNPTSNYLSQPCDNTSSNQLPLTPQTPISDHSHNNQNSSFLAATSGDECHSSSEGELANSESILSPPVVNNKPRLWQYKGDRAYSHYEEEINADYESRSPLNDRCSESNQCYTRPPTPVLLRKNTPTPDMSHLGVYTPDSSTNSGFNSTDADVNHLNLESPSSLNSNEMPRSVEPSPPTSTPPQSYIEPMHMNYCSSDRSPPLNVPITTGINTHNSMSHKTTKCTPPPPVTLNSPQSQMHHQMHHQNSHMHHQDNNTYNQQHPASAALSSMVSNNNPVGPSLLLSQPTGQPTHNYLNAVNIGMSSPAPNAVGNSYMVGVIQSHHHHQQQQQQQPPPNQASHGGSMQRLSHISMPITTSSCAVTSFQIQSPQYSYTNATTAQGQNTSCSLAKLQQLTNGIVEITPNQYSSMTPPPSYNSPTHQSNLTPPPTSQRSIAPMIQPQPPISSNQVHAAYTNYNRYHPRAVQRTSNIAISPNIIGYQTVNGVSYSMQQAPLRAGATLLNTTPYMTNTGFMNQASPSMPMGVVNIHSQGQYQDGLQQVRPQSPMYAYSYHLSGNLPPQALMRR